MVKLSTPLNASRLKSNGIFSLKRTESERVEKLPPISFFHINNGNDIGVDPKLHFIPPHRKAVPSPYLKGRAWFDTSVKMT